MPAGNDPSVKVTDYEQSIGLNCTYLDTWLVPMLAQNTQISCVPVSEVVERYTIPLFEIVISGMLFTRFVQLPEDA